MASLRASIRNQKSCLTRPSDTPPPQTQKLADPGSGSLLLQAIDCMFSGSAVSKVFEWVFSLDPVRVGYGVYAFSKPDLRGITGEWCTLFMLRSKGQAQ